MEGHGTTRKSSYPKNFSAALHGMGANQLALKVLGKAVCSLQDSECPLLHIMYKATKPMKRILNLVNTEE